MHVQINVLFCKHKSIGFFLPFSLPLPSSLLKLPIVVIQKFATMVTWRHTSLYLSGLLIDHYRKYHNIP